MVESTTLTGELAVEQDAPWYGTDVCASSFVDTTFGSGSSEARRTRVEVSLVGLAVRQPTAPARAVLASRQLRHLLVFIVTCALVQYFRLIHDPYHTARLVTTVYYGLLLGSLASN